MARHRHPTSPGSARDRPGELLRSLRADAGMSLDDLARAAQCSKALLSMIERGRRAMSARVAATLERALGVRDGRLQDAAAWSRVPPALRATLSAAAPPHASRANRAGRADPPPAMRAIPIINRVAAGQAREYTDLDLPRSARGEVLADEALVCPGVRDPDAFAARVEGDSMEPEYREGDVVVFSPAAPMPREGGAGNHSRRSGAPAAPAGVDCLVRLERDGEITFKRVYIERGGRTLRLQPLNSAYPPITVRREDVAGLFPAVYVLRRVGGRR